MSDKEEDDLFSLFGELDDYNTDAPPETQIDESDSDEMSEMIAANADILNYVGVDGDKSPPMGIVENVQQTKPAELEFETFKTTLVTTNDVETIPIPSVPVEPPLVDIRKQFDQFDEVAQEVIQGTRHDRQEIQDAIDLCRSEIDKAVTRSANPSRMWVDNLTKALEIKATVNLTAIKALEAKAKLLAATKAGVNVVNTNNNAALAASATASDDELVRVLQNPFDSGGEDEY